MTDPPISRDITRITLAVIFIGPVVLAVTYKLLEAWALMDRHDSPTERGNPS